LDDILEGARAKNARLSITGILLYRSGRFYQYLEGPERQVRAVYRDIQADDRHERLRVLLEGPAAARRFTDWTMGYEPLREAAEVVPAGVRSTFADLDDPSSAENVLRAVTELAVWYRVRAARTAALG